MQRNIIIIILILLLTTAIAVNAQQPTPATTATTITISGRVTDGRQLAALQRLEAMQPDSIGPKYQQASLLLGTVCTNPKDSKAQQYIDEAQRIIGKIEALKPQRAADRSDLATLRGFYYTAVIVTDPQQNGPRYYRQALGNFDEALKLNPDNKMARMLQQRFMQGMQQ